jgi:OmpA-OmpF porin, OOP family
MLAAQWLDPSNWHLPCSVPEWVKKAHLRTGMWQAPGIQKPVFVTGFDPEQKRSSPKMNRTSLIALLALSVAATVGCSSKNYVRQQTTPLINKTNELDDLTAKNTNAIKDVDARAQQGIQEVNAKTAEVDQKAQAAAQQAGQAQTVADNAVHRVDVLQNAVANLDNYRVVTETSVHFGFDKDNLTKNAQEALDQLANDVPNAKGYIITVEGGTDSVGSAEYNYGLSERRADSVIQYLASKHNIPAHKIYLVGLGKDKPVDDNKTRDGRAKNRRVDVRLMTNTVEGSTPAQQQAPAPPAPPSM